MVATTQLATVSDTIAKSLSAKAERLFCVCILTAER